MGAPLQHTIRLIFAEGLPPLSFSFGLISTITPKGCSSLLSTPVASSSGRRSPAGSSTLYVWINRRVIVCSIFVRGTSWLLDRFVGLFIFTLHQLYINTFRCESASIEQLQKGNKI